MRLGPLCTSNPTRALHLRVLKQEQLAGVTEPLVIVLCAGTKFAVQVRRQFLVVEDDTAFYDVLIGQETINRHGLMVDPFWQHLAYRPFFQSRGDVESIYAIPISSLEEIRPEEEEGSRPRVPRRRSPSSRPAS